MTNRPPARAMSISESRTRIRSASAIAKMFGMTWNISWKNLMVNASSASDRPM